MEYLDLNKLEVRKTDDFFAHFHECRMVISDADLDMPLSQFHNKLTNELQPLFEQLEDDVPTMFCIVLNCEDIPYDDIEILTDDFISFSQQITSVIFSHLIGEPAQPREREFRLDVPANLKEQVCMSLHWLKSAINYQTKINKFNIIIRGYFKEEACLQFYLVNNNGQLDHWISTEGTEVCEH